MSRKNIGTLSAVVTANAAGLISEFRRVDNTIARSTTRWQRSLKGGLKLGAGFLGLQAGLGSVISEIRHVIRNIEEIPGIPATAVNSVQEFRGGMAQLRNVIDQGIARLIDFGAAAGKAVGAGAAMLGGASAQDVADGLTRQESPDEVAAARDSGYYDRVSQAREKLVEASRRSALATQAEGEQIRTLREVAERFERYAQSRSITSLQALEAQTQAAERNREANEKLARLRREMADAEAAVAKSQFGAATATLRGAEALEATQNKVARLNYELAQLRELLRANSEDGSVIEQITAKNKELAETNKQLEKITDRVNERFREMGREAAESLESAVLSGGSLREMLRGIEQDLIRLLVRRMITEPLADLLGGSGGKGGILRGIGKAVGFFADGGRPPVGQASIVGERGPEVFVPDRAGTIIPNHRLGAAAPAGRAGGTYYIDARGADRTGLARLEAMIRAIDGSIEHRSVAAVADFRRRGAAMA